MGLTRSEKFFYCVYRYVDIAHPCRLRIDVAQHLIKDLVSRCCQLVEMISAEKGKLKKVALTACRHKLLIFLNAMLKNGQFWQPGASVPSS